MKNRRKYLSRTIILMCVIFALCISIGVGSFGFITYYNGMIDKYQNYISGILKMSLSQIDADDLKSCMETGVISSKYKETQEFFNTIKYNYDIQYIYIVNPLNTSKRDNMEYVMIGITQEEIDNGIKVELGDLSGDQYDSEVAQYYINAMKGDNQISYYANTTEFGYMYTGLVPICDSVGNSVAILSVDISMKDIRNTAVSYIKIVLLGSIILTLVFVSVLYRWMRRRVIMPISLLEHAAKNIINDTHDVTKRQELKFEKPDINTNDEIQSLSDSLNIMSEDLKHYITTLIDETKEKERIESELSVAQEIQANILPSIFPAFPEIENIDIYATMNPAKEVGGDFYDFFLIDEDHMVITIADVSGKGIPAALFMMISKTLLKNQAEINKSPARILEIVNNQLCENNEAEMFVTVWLGIMEISTGKVVAANAGHEYPVIRKANGKFELLKDKHGFVLAGMEGMKYKDYEFEIESGGSLFIYTDGVPEASDSENELFGTERMLKALNKKPDLEPAQLLIAVKEEISRFVLDAPQFDDITMVAVKRV